MLIIFIGGWQWQRCGYDNRCWWTNAKQSGEWSTPCKYNFSHSLDVCSNLDQVWSILPALELLPFDLSLLAAWPVKGDQLQCRQKLIIVDLVPSYTQDTGLFFYCLREVNLLASFQLYQSTVTCRQGKTIVVAVKSLRIREISCPYIAGVINTIIIFIE